MTQWASKFCLIVGLSKGPLPGLGRFRRLSKDYEVLIETSKAMIHVAMIRLMTRRLAAHDFWNTLLGHTFSTRSRLHSYV